MKSKKIWNPPTVETKVLYEKITIIRDLWRKKKRTAKKNSLASARKGRIR